MAIISLTTDMGIRDYYVGSIKGAIYSQLPDVQIVDISHSIKPWDILQAAFVVKNAYLSFPKGTTHIIGVDTEPAPGKTHLAAEYDGHFFIGADNGIFSLIFDKKVTQLVELNNIQPGSEFLTFPTRDIFVKAACHIARGGTLEVLGRETSGFKQVNIGNPATDEHTIVGKVIYVDNYENVICNITIQTFKEISKGRSFTIFKGGASYHVDKISSSYSDEDGGDIVLLFNSLGYMEIAINRGNASGLLNLKVGDQIRIIFDE